MWASRSHVRVVPGAPVDESRWWRGNRGFSIIAGIGLEEENTLIEKILDIQPASIPPCTTPEVSG